MNCPKVKKGLLIKQKKKYDETARLLHDIQKYLSTKIY